MLDSLKQWGMVQLVGHIWKVVMWPVAYRIGLRDENC